MTISIASDRVPVSLKGYVRSEGIPPGPLGTDNILTFPFRPAEIRQRHGMRYASIAPVGMSHDYKSFDGGNAISWSFELYANANMLRADQAGLPGGEDFAGVIDQIEQARRFLEAHTVPPEPVPTQFGASPAACLVCVPGVFTARCRMSSLQFIHTDCDSRGRIIEWRADVEWTEAPMGRITAEGVLQAGSFRSWGT